MKGGKRRNHHRLICKPKVKSLAHAFNMVKRVLHLVYQSSLRVTTLLNYTAISNFGIILFDHRFAQCPPQ